ncbi:MAG: molybdopterin-dependent oxidoreductase [Thermoleophilia bacterium]|nr:molybdopterin-dependent oxidoreductase [Thermoleophilia bacterium]
MVTPRETTGRPLGSGLLVGLALTAALTALFFLGYRVAGLPFIPFDVFDWLTRVLPGRLIIFGIDQMVAVLELLGLNIKDTAKTAEHLQAVAGFLVTGALIGLVFFAFVRSADRVRVWFYGLGAGLLMGSVVLVIVLTLNTSATAPRAVTVIWILFAFLGWGSSLSWSALRAGMPAERPLAAGPRLTGEGETAQAEGALPAVSSFAADAGQVVLIDRRRFLIRLGGATAAITLVGTGLGAVVRTGEPTVEPPVAPPIPFPNADSPVQPVPGTRPEYPPVADHYRIDINTLPPNVDGAEWRLPVTGLVARPLTLTLDEIMADYEPANQFVTLSCISNPVAGPLIGTTLWTGARFRDVLEGAGVQSAAAYARVTSVDGFHETVPLDLVRSEPRIMLTYQWNGAPLPREHGYPLRIYIPDRYGMKQPKWITQIDLTAEFVPGFWVARNWNQEAIMRATSVIDIVAVDDIIERDGAQFVPVGGIAHAGARSISQVEVQVDDGDWQQATLRAPLSKMTWVIWRFEWPYQAGEHTFSVRCRDQEGNLQIAERSGTFPDGATGIHSRKARL